MNTRERAIPVAPGRLPLIGHTASLARNAIGLFESLRDQGDVVRIQLGRRPVYVVTDPELVHRVMVTQSQDFVQGRLYDKLAPIVDNGVAGTDGEFHLSQRRAVAPVFRQARIARHTEVIRERTLDLTRSWRPGQLMSLDREMHRLTTTTMAETLFGRALDDQDVDWLQDNVPFIFKVLAIRSFSPSDLLDHVPTADNRRFAKVRRRLRAIVADIVLTHRRSGADGDDLLSTLVRAHRDLPGNGISDKQLADELATIVITAIEPSATVLAWVFHHLAHDQEVERRMHEEIDAELGGRPVTYTDLTRLPYTDRVVKEVLRLRNPIYFLMRRTARAVRLGRYDLPAGAEVMWSTTVIHRNAAVYTDPHVFAPDRWLEVEPGPSHYLPFGAGPHKCLGHRFAEAEITVVAATIAARWRFRIPPEAGTGEIPLGVLHPEELLLSLEARNVPAAGRSW